MQAMDQQQDPQEENPEMLDTNIKEFIAAARQHFFGLVNGPAQQNLSSACRVH